MMTKQDNFLKTDGKVIDGSFYQVNADEAPMIDEGAIFLVLKIDVREDVIDVALLLTINY